MIAETSHKPATEPTATVELNVRVIPFAVGADQLDVALLDSGSHSGGHMLKLPGGNLEPHETLEQAASRIAIVTLTTPPDYLEQLYTFSSAGSPAQVGVTYFALLSHATRLIVERSEGITFRYVDRLDCLSSKDQHVVGYAKTRLRAKLGYSNVAFHLLPREFTLSDLQAVYESVLGEPLDKRNFRRRVLAAEIIESLGAKRPTNHRPATLYRFVGGDPSRGALTPAQMDWKA